MTLLSCGFETDGLDESIDVIDDALIEAISSSLCSRLTLLSCGFETDGLDESIDVIDDALIEAIELRSLLLLDLAI